MSNCSECNLPIEEGARIIEMPCCDLKFHSICGIQKLGGMLSYSYNAACYCGNVIYQNNYHSENDESNLVSIDAHIETVKAKEGVKAEMKAIRTKSTMLKKAYSEFFRRVKNTKTLFDAALLPHTLAIKTLKEQYITPIKASEEWKKLRGAKTGLQFLQGKFMKKHQLSYRHMSRLLGGSFGRYAGWRYRTPQSFLRRFFRIRL
jgi:hypothetical protein